jgi:hypothetical protein
VKEVRLAGEPFQREVGRSGQYASAFNVDQEFVMHEIGVHAHGAISRRLQGKGRGGRMSISRGLVSTLLRGLPLRHLFDVGPCGAADLSTDQEAVG